MKKLIFSLLFLVFSLNCWATESMLLSNSGATLSTTDTEYMPILGSGLTTNSSTRKSIVSAPGTLTNFQVYLSAAPGANSFRTFTVCNQDGVTALTVTISNSDTTAIDTTNSVSISAGDTLYIQSEVDVDAPAAAYAKINIEFNSTTTSETNLVSSSSSTALSTADGVTEYLPFSWATVLSNEAYSQIPIPTAGTIKNFYVALGTAPGTGDTRTFTIRKNSGDTSTSCSISGSGTTCNDTSNTFTVVAGDVINIKEVTSSPGTLATTRGYASSTFVPNTEGQFVFLRNGQIDASNGRYFPLPGISSGSSTESSHTNYPYGLTLKSIYFMLPVAPGGSTARTFTLRDDGSNTALAQTLSGEETTDSITTDVSVASGSLVSIYMSNTGTPAASPVAWGVLGYIAPTGGETPAVTQMADVFGFVDGICNTDCFGIIN